MAEVKQGAEPHEVGVRGAVDRVEERAVGDEQDVRHQRSGVSSAKTGGSRGSRLIGGGVRAEGAAEAEHGALDAVVGGGGEGEGGGEQRGEDRANQAGLGAAPSKGAAAQGGSVAMAAQSTNQCER